MKINVGLSTVFLNEPLKYDHNSTSYDIQQWQHNAHACLSSEADRAALVIGRNTPYFSVFLLIIANMAGVSRSKFKRAELFIWHLHIHHRFGTRGESRLCKGGRLLHIMSNILKHSESCTVHYVTHRKHLFFFFLARNCLIVTFAHLVVPCWISYEMVRVKLSGPFSRPTSAVSCPSLSLPSADSHWFPYYFALLWQHITRQHPTRSNAISFSRLWSPPGSFISLTLPTRPCHHYHFTGSTALTHPIHLENGTGSSQS